MDGENSYAGIAKCDTMTINENESPSEANDNTAPVTEVTNDNRPSQIEADPNGGAINTGEETPLEVQSSATCSTAISSSGAVSSMTVTTSASHPVNTTVISRAIVRHSSEAQGPQPTSPNDESSQGFSNMESSQANVNMSSSQARGSQLPSPNIGSSQPFANMNSGHAQGLPTRFTHHPGSSHSHSTPPQMVNPTPSQFRPLPPILPANSESSRYLPNLPPRRSGLQPQLQIPTQTLPPGTDASTSGQGPQRFQLSFVYIRSLYRGPGRRFFIRALLAFAVAVALVIIGAILSALDMIAQFITPLVIAAVILLLVGMWYLFRAHRAQLGRNNLTQMDIERNTVVCVIDIQNQQRSSSNAPPNYNDVIQQTGQRGGYANPSMLASPPPYGSSSSTAGYTPPVITISPPSYSSISSLGVTHSNTGHIGPTHSDARSMGATHSDARSMGVTCSGAGSMGVTHSDARSMGVTHSNTAAVSIPPSYEEATMLAESQIDGDMITNQNENIPTITNLSDNSAIHNNEADGMVNDGFVADESNGPQNVQSPPDERVINETDIRFQFDSSQATRL
ncbi:unnamed protein product [Owenia fusiformis]|uniref:Uncharacterized protein n=1 Tax=Owenia fusiformis TaxID=6347 RepID=A0A8J1UNF3_OWEFU|nr:unnamed protein product [Owenia fusiformis]